MIVPKSLRKDMKYLLHIGHLGIGIPVIFYISQVLMLTWKTLSIVVTYVKSTKINKKIKVQ